MNITIAIETQFMTHSYNIKPEQLDQTLPAVNIELDEQEHCACNDIWYNLPRVCDPLIAFR